MHCTHSPHCAAEAMARAEAICLARGARLTPMRRAVLAEIWADHDASKAYDLIDRLSRPGHSIKPPTVYRALDFLLAHGLIHRIESLNAFIGCHHPQTPHQAILLICDHCGEIEEQSSEPLNEQLKTIAQAAEFTPTRQSIELRGTCRHCSPPATGKARP
ncbi:Fur family transcriptional regulator [Halothiobacillus sp. DCM-1]|uniref:Fur family transcriptional regulator n=1 Tax=Halothiobacillus sp. DCM-1 TaxID=3112558 RepID=UPI0032501E3F